MFKTLFRECQQKKIHVLLLLLLYLTQFLYMKKSMTVNGQPSLRFWKNRSRSHNHNRSL